MGRGKGPRMDLQDLHTSEECAHGLAAMLSARDRAFATTSDPFARRGPRNTVSVTYQPPEPERKGRVNPATLDVAGAPSICRKFDIIRKEEYAHERFAAVKIHHIKPSAIAR